MVQMPVGLDPEQLPPPRPLHVGARLCSSFDSALRPPSRGPGLAALWAGVGEIFPEEPRRLQHEPLQAMALLNSALCKEAVNYPGWPCTRITAAVTVKRKLYFHHFSVKANSE